MSGLIERVQDTAATSDEQLRVLDVEAEESDDVFDALATETRRAVFRSLFDEPGAASEIADRVDTSLQNVHYHLETLTEAGLVDEIDTRYSAKGNEMTVYGPASDPLVFVGNRDIRPRVERSLGDIVGGVGLLGAAALFVQFGAERLAGPTVGGAASPASPTSLGVSPGTLTWFVFEVIEPGVLFFCVCLALAAAGSYVLDR
jgi:DNA-binding transcriptional ArsR family regulator